MSEWPQHDLVTQSYEDSSTIVNFLEFLGTKGITLGEFILQPGHLTETYMPVTLTKEQLLAEHHGIDLDAFNAEKEALYASLTST